MCKLFQLKMLGAMVSPVERQKTQPLTRDDETGGFMDEMIFELTLRE